MIQPGEHVAMCTSTTTHYYRMPTHVPSLVPLAAPGTGCGKWMASNGANARVALDHNNMDMITSECVADDLTGVYVTRHNPCSFNRCGWYGLMVAPRGVLAPACLRYTPIGKSEVPTADDNIKQQQQQSSCTGHHQPWGKLHKSRLCK